MESEISLDSVIWSQKFPSFLLLIIRYCLINSSDKVIGGPFTRYDPANPLEDAKKSVLDLCIVSQELFDYVDVLEIDNKFSFTPARPGKNGLLYTDHYSLLLRLKNLPVKGSQPNQTIKSVRWNTNKEGGWKSYSDLAGDSAKLWKIANDDTCEDPELLFRHMKKELETIKYKAFGKVKVKSTRKELDEIDNLQTKKIAVYDNRDAYNEDDFKDAVKSVDEEISAALLTNQRKMLEAELTSFKNI